MRGVFLLLIAIGTLWAQEEKLLFYCGATMVPPMQKIASEFSRKYHIKIQILQGGSGDLLRRLTTEKRGDLYLPGCTLYLQKARSGLFVYEREVGSNRLAILVKKGNPLKITGVEDLLREDVRTAVGAADLGSIGRVTRKVLRRYGGEEFYRQVQSRALYFVTDSRELIQMLLHGKVDAGISWRASAYFPKYREYLEAIDLPDRLAPPQRLKIAVSAFSRQPKTARAFVDFAASDWGRAVMKRYGFE